MGAQAPKIPLGVAERPGLSREGFNPPELCLASAEGCPGVGWWQLSEFGPSSLSLVLYCLKSGGEKKNQPTVKSLKLPNLFTAAVAVSLASFSVGKGPHTCRVHSQCRWPAGPATNTQRRLKGLWQSSTFTRRVVGLHSESLGVERMRRREERVLSLFSFRSA